MFSKGQMGIYIHWPFCLSKCPYCDFNVYTSDPGDQKIWSESYLKSLKYYADQTSDRSVSSIYFGGGTPSLMVPQLISNMIVFIRDHWNVEQDVEITIEANPTSSETAKFESFRDAGVNRLSLGVQSLQDEALSFFGRLHGRDDVMRALAVTKDVFPNYSFDLIYDRPKQTSEDWRAELKEALGYAGAHISAYQLTIHHGTAFERQVDRGDFCLPDEETSLALMHTTFDVLSKAGLEPYEISNFSKTGYQSKQNRIYWEYRDYIGVGAGAHGRVRLGDQKYACLDTKKPKEWLSCVHDNGHGLVEKKPLTKQDQFEESVLMGLRLYEGFDLNVISSDLNVDWTGLISQQKLQTLQQKGWANIDQDNHINLTPAGMLRYDSIITYLLG